LDVATKIKAYLEENGISQTHISKKTEIPLQKLNLTLNGNRRMTFEEYEKVCWALGLSADTFLEPRAPKTHEH
jgi:transcriptional regulator with XRE-family HTH domain